MATFYDRFCECAERWPNNTALEIQRRDRVESCTYLQLKHMAESIGRWLAEGGFKDGARVAILAENHPRWVAVYLAGIAAGCTVVPLDTALHADQVTKLLKDSQTTILFCDARHSETARAAGADLSIELALTNPGEMEDASISARWFGNLDSILAGGPGKFVVSPRSPEDVAALLYTSGTTADPKGVMLSNANLMAEADGVSGWAQLGPDDALLGILPMFHVLAGMANLLLPLVNGARVVYLETLNTTELLRALQQRSITAFAVVPQFFYLIHERIFKEVAKRGMVARRALRSLMKVNRTLRKVGINGGRVFFGKVHAIFGARMRYLVTGGSRFDPHIAQDFYDLGIDVLQAYGLTETTGGAFVNAVGDNAIGSVGKPLRGVQGKILNGTPDGEGYSVGEIAIAGGIVMKGYWNRPDATAAILKDGWLHTGDLGYFDAKGNLFITGRQKELIVLANGKNIYPEEIEAHYLKSPYIKEICVMGLEARPGDPTSERLYAAVVPNFEVLKQRKIVNAKEVIRFDIEGMSAKLPSTKRIGSYEIWQEDLPRTTTRKLKRFEIKNLVKAQRGRKDRDAELSAEKPLSAEDSAWLERPEVQRGLKVIREASRNAPGALRPSQNLELDLGLDSMQRVELLVGLEQELGGDVEESRLAEIYTVRELVDEVLQSAGSGKTRASFAGWAEVLREDPADPDVLVLAKVRPWSDAVLFAASRLVQIVSRDRFDLKVTGLEKVPARGPYLLCSNHQSFIDAVVMTSLLGWPVFRVLFSVGTSEIFGSGFMRKLARLLRVVVVDPDANLVPAMRAGAFGLRHGRVLILYPEGERSIDGEPKTFKKGAAILAIHQQVPIVPVAIDGFHEAWPRGKSFQKFAQLKIAFGEPIYPPAEDRASEKYYEQLTRELRARVYAMWAELHGATAHAHAARAG
jgi:long-chain acyl-CoA synthetase